MSIEIFKEVFPNATEPAVLSRFISGVGHLRTASGSIKPPSLYSSSPASIQFRIPDDSDFSLPTSFSSTLPSGMYTVNGINRILRQIPSSVPRIPGRWLVPIEIFKIREQKKKNNHT